MSASAAPTNADKAILKTAIASVVSVDESSIRNFAVTHTAGARRRRLRATMYTWTVSFDIVVSLSSLADDSISSAADLSSSVSNSLDKNLEDALSTAGVDLSVESVESSAPNEDSTDDNSSDDGGASSAGAIAGGVVGGVVLLFGSIALGMYKRRHKIQPMMSAGVDGTGSREMTAELEEADEDVELTGRGPAALSLRHPEPTSERKKSKAAVAAMEEQYHEHHQNHHHKHHQSDEQR
jgi:hypothetical protein